jgi:hypothetical protein
MSKYCLFLLCILTLLPTALTGQGKKLRFFKESCILKPFVSEIRSNVIKTEFAFINKLDDNYYITDYTSRPFIETHLGVDLPVIYYADNPKKLKLSLNGEIGNILLIDMFEENTAPVINTDYFFGLRAGAVKYIGNSWIKNVGMKIIPVFHESTHIGDEFALHGFSLIPDFKRINISYEAWEIAAVLNDPDTIRTNLVSVKAGIQGLWNRSKGYYATDTLETKGAIVPSGKKNMEYHIQFNVQRTEGHLCSDTWMQVISVEVRNRIKFSYDDAVPEQRTWNYNIYFGYDHVSKSGGRNIGFYLRYYAGIIPNGQFRNTGGYRYVALGVVYH